MAEADAKESAAILRGIEEMERVLSGDGPDALPAPMVGTNLRSAREILAAHGRSTLALEAEERRARAPNLHLVKSQRPETPESLAELRVTVTRRVGEIT